MLSGENGSGKSSFFHFLKLNKKDIFTNHSVGFVDQLPFAPLGQESLNDVLEFMLSEYSNNFDSESSSKFCKLFQMNEFLDVPISSLSGGQNQLAKLLLCFSFQHDLFICDEPFQYLDKDRRERLADFFQEQVKGERSLLIIDHLNIFPVENIRIWNLVINEQGGRIHA